MTNLFADAEIISTYTDAQALEDGQLVDITSMRVKFRGVKVNRMTRTVWDAYEKGPLASGLDIEPCDARCADCLACRMYAAVTGPVLVDEIKASLRAKFKYASDSVGDGMLIQAVGLWFVANEVSGYTVMFPEDY